uniref:Ion_trans domain-containing protein n=1 Tax=Macrostomum lignano TaxID=282301 RepID=A0A1I8JQD1_9PLAT
LRLRAGAAGLPGLLQPASHCVSVLKSGFKHQQSGCPLSSHALDFARPLLGRPERALAAAGPARDNLARVPGKNQSGLARPGQGSRAHLALNKLEEGSGCGIGRAGTANGGGARGTRARPMQSKPNGPLQNHRSGGHGRSTGAEYAALTAVSHGKASSATCAAWRGVRRAPSDNFSVGSSANANRCNLTLREMRKQRRRDMKERFAPARPWRARGRWRRLWAAAPALHRAPGISRRYLGSRIVFDPAGQFIHWWCTVVSLAFLYNLWVILFRVAFMEIEASTMKVWFPLDYTMDLIPAGHRRVLSHRLPGGRRDGGQSDSGNAQVLHYMDSTRSTSTACACCLWTCCTCPSTSSPSCAPSPLQGVQILPVSGPHGAPRQLPEPHRSLKLGHYLMLIIHTNACVLKLVIQNNPDFLSHAHLHNDSWRAELWYFPNPNTSRVDEQYLFSLYWSSMAVSLMAEMPKPNALWHYVFVICEIVFCLLLFATVLGHAVFNIVANTSMARRDFQGGLLQSDGVCCILGVVPQFLRVTACSPAVSALQSACCCSSACLLHQGCRFSLRVCLHPWVLLHPRLLQSAVCCQSLRVSAVLRVPQSLMSLQVLGVLLPVLGHLQSLDVCLQSCVCCIRVSACILMSRKSWRTVVKLAAALKNLAVCPAGSGHRVGPRTHRLIPARDSALRAPERHAQTPLAERAGSRVSGGGASTQSCARAAYPENSAQAPPFHFWPALLPLIKRQALPEVKPPQRAKRIRRLPQPCAGLRKARTARRLCGFTPGGLPARARTRSSSFAAAEATLQQTHELLLRFASTDEFASKQDTAGAVGGQLLLQLMDTDLFRREAALTGSPVLSSYPSALHLDAVKIYMNLTQGAAESAVQGDPLRSTTCGAPTQDGGRGEDPVPACRTSSRRRWAIHVHLDTLKQVRDVPEHRGGLSCPTCVLRLRPVLFSPGDFVVQDK